MRRNPYAPMSRSSGGYQSAYDAGLSYFPDVSTGIVPTPMGDWMTALATAAGTAAGGPAGGVAAGTATSVVQKWFGGSAIDQQRQERVNYVAQHAVNNNVAAMRIILGAPPNVSGNERQMWLTAYDLVKQANPDVVRDAEAEGPAWLPNSGDTATNYPRLQEFIRAWASQHPVATVTGAVGGAIADFFTPAPAQAPGGFTAPIPTTANQTLPTIPARSSGVSSTTVLLGAGALVALALLRKRR